MLSDHKRINELELEVKEIKKEIRLLVKQFNNDMAAVSKILNNLQPVLGNLIAAVVVLQRKGTITNDELNKVAQEEADKFIAEANPKLVNELQGESEKQRLGANFRAQQPAVSGDAGIGGNATRSEVQGCPTTGASSEVSNGIDNVSTAEKKDLQPVG